MSRLRCRQLPADEAARPLSQWRNCTAVSRTRPDSKSTPLHEPVQVTCRHSRRAPDGALPCRHPRACLLTMCRHALIMCRVFDRGRVNHVPPLLDYLRLCHLELNAMAIGLSCHGMRSDRLRLGSCDYFNSPSRACA